MKNRIVLARFTQLLIVLTALVMPAKAAAPIEGPRGQGTKCKSFYDYPRDARNYLDACMYYNQAGCASQWCGIIAIENGFYCATCGGGYNDCYCDGIGHSGYTSDGFCAWGYGSPENPRPNGECYCQYNEYNLVPITLYECAYD